jgi:hypothetical protein
MAVSGIRRGKLQWKLPTSRGNEGTCNMDAPHSPHSSNWRLIACTPAASHCCCHTGPVTQQMMPLTTAQTAVHGLLFCCWPSAYLLYFMWVEVQHCSSLDTHKVEGGAWPAAYNAHRLREAQDCGQLRQVALIHLQYKTAVALVSMKQTAPTGP